MLVEQQTSCLHLTFIVIPFVILPLTFTFLVLFFVMQLVIPSELLEQFAELQLVIQPAFVVYHSLSQFSFSDHLHI